MKQKSIFKNFGPAFLILALGIGSGEFILWPYLSAKYGFGVLWGAILGITIQLFLINLISRNTIIFKENILNSFQKVFSKIYFWIIFSTILGFAWPGFSSLTSEIIIKGFQLNENLFLPLSVFILILSGGILVFSKSAYKKILFLEKIIMSLLLLLIIFLFAFYFDWNVFKKMIFGYLGFGDDYNFIPKSIQISVFSATFLGAIAYAGSGGNLLLSNSFYIEEEQKGKKSERGHEKINQIYWQNLLFFWLGGVIIISMLSYISYILLKSKTGLEDNFSFLILESRVLSNDISPYISYIFILFGAMTIFGVQLGVLDFIGRLVKFFKNSFSKHQKKISDLYVYNLTVIFVVLFGILILMSGVNKPKTLIVLGAVINSLSMGVIAFLLLLLELKILPKKYKSKKNIFFLISITIFYLFFFGFVLWKNIF